MLYLLLQTSYVQTALVQYITQQVKASTGVTIQIGHVDFRPVKSLVLKEVLLKDFKNDTLLYCQDLRVKADSFNIVNKSFTIGEIVLNQADFNLWISRGEGSPTNIEMFLDSLQRVAPADTEGEGGEKQSGWLMGLKKVSLRDSRFTYREEEYEPVDYGVNWTDVECRDLNVDITDFDYVSYLYKIDRMMLNEELATAIMLGDGRDDGDEGKISPDHIRPIWTDDDLYTIHTDIDVAKAKKEIQGSNTGVNFGENFIIAEAMVNTILYAREDYKGTGTPDLYIAPHRLNQMLLARDNNGRRIYNSVAELATALNVGSINTAEQFENKIRTTSDSKKKKLVAIVANLADYSLGATKGGEITHFTQFDIDFNQEKSLLETRCSGALTRVYSAIAIEEDVTESETAHSAIAG